MFDNKIKNHQETAEKLLDLCTKKIAIAKLFFYFVSKTLKFIKKNLKAKCVLRSYVNV